MDDGMKQYTALTIPSMKAISKIVKPRTAVSLFSGCGGSSLGLRLAGFRVLYANEFIPTAAAIYRANMEKHTYLDSRDIRDIKPAEILKIIGMKRGELDYLDGSPPCKLFSASARLRSTMASDAVVKYSDNISQRVDDLFDNFCRILSGLQPKVFVAENVTGLTQGKSLGVFSGNSQRPAIGWIPCEGSNTGCITPWHSTETEARNLHRCSQRLEDGPRVPYTLRYSPYWRTRHNSRCSKSFVWVESE
jgi:site-specific DNA-cytosine methylase